MSSSQQQIVNMVAAPRTGGKLCLDSQQEQRRQQQERQYQQEIKQKKQQKRKRRQEAQRIEKQKMQIEEQKERKYENPELMFEEDSDQGIQFRRVVKKIKKAFPQFTNRHETSSSKRKNDFIDDQDSEQDSEEESGSESVHKAVEKKKKIQKKQKRPSVKPVEKRVRQAAPVKKQAKVKTQHRSDRKQNLVRQVSIRWWYALPEWPPKNFDYDSKLKQLGFRNVGDAVAYANEPQVLNGLIKVYPVDGYLGIFKTKTKLIDVRPKDSAPTLNNFRSMSTEELSSILKKALTVQIQQLKQVKHKQLGEDDLMKDLERELVKLK